MNSRQAGAIVTIFAGLMLAACADNDGPAEDLGERIDDAMDEARDRAEDAADEAREAADEIGDAIRGEN
jgi:hypothetical protein